MVSRRASSPAGISTTTRSSGSAEDDPKRHHLSPKVNKRWYKLLYCTPALFPIYFRAARRESVTYDSALQARIAGERKVSIAAHLGAIALVWYLFGFYAALRTNIIPVFFIFPIAFTLNRLGQHYDIDPSDPAKWGTLMRGHWFWDFAFLNSNYHLEHHYFPGVPFYRLPALQRELVPFYERKGTRWQTYGRLLYGWFIENRAPHTDWSVRTKEPGVQAHRRFACRWWVLEASGGYGGNGSQKRSNGGNEKRRIQSPSCLLRCLR